MKKTLMAAAVLWCSLMGAHAQQWSPAGDRIRTEWAEKIDVNNVWPEYPRPIMERGEWQNLNGLWQYAIVDRNAAKPAAFDGQILVPFCAESSLSGVGKTVGKDKELWYERTFTVPGKWSGRRVLLQFGAVDWKCDVWVNGANVGGHTGGYTAFGLDITDALQKGENQLTVRVWDPTDESYIPTGKQKVKPEGIWYTPVTGIWQTVWLEPVQEQHINNLRITPDIDHRRLTVQAELSCSRGVRVEVTVLDGTTEVARGAAVNGLPVELQMPADMKLWTPDTPHLYTLQVRALAAGKEVDKVSSYAAMRKYSSRRDKNGIMRMQLNNKDIFMYGPLDQGWWPDGLYTAPCHEALKYDLIKTKDWGFNMIRKHIKVEPARWYTYCDQLGIILWQDMPSGDGNPQWQMTQYFTGTERNRSAESEACYRKEWKEIMDCLYSYPCIGVWVPFNEAWGQFKTPEIAAWTKQYDPTRLVNPASGGNHYTCGDILDLHRYPEPEMYLYDAQRVTVLGEFGGLGLVVQDHLWTPDRNWGYREYKNSTEVTDAYVKAANVLLDMVPRGFSAGVYTQTTDVEIEVNGIMTYDRKVIKMDEKRVREINQKLCHSLDK